MAKSMTKIIQMIMPIVSKKGVKPQTSSTNSNISQIAANIITGISDQASIANRRRNLFFGDVLDLPSLADYVLSTPCGALLYHF